MKSIRAKIVRTLLFVSTGLVLVAVLPGVAHGQSIIKQYPQVAAFFPEADRFGELQGTPPAAGVYRGRRLLGYVFVSTDVVQIPAYSGQPIKFLVALDVNGRITGIEIIEHAEPILLAGVTEEELKRFVSQYLGKVVTDRIRVGGDERHGDVYVDAISGATITVMVANATIIKSARKVLAAHERPSVTSSRRKPGHPQVEKKTTAPSTLSPSTLDRKPLKAAPVEVEPSWKMVWRQRYFQIVVLGVGLALLLWVVIFQDWLAKRPVLLNRLRIGYLLFTLFFIGWYGLAQLSVVNVLVFIKAAMHDFKWDTFLIDPMIFILWSFVAISLLLWGRGVYCGWLCPFGALQELVNKVARYFRVKQLELPPILHERLWALKYIVLLMLFGMSLQSLGAAEQLAEIEPFSTAITLRFQRQWGYVLYAVALIAASVFNLKLFCRYLCPLGAALAIPGKYRLFDWLRRRKECGKPCQICAEECEVRAIRPTGEIDGSECHYCLDCQVIYWDVYRCPPLVEQRERQGRSRE